MSGFDAGQIKAITVDTGGTVLDWYTGMVAALRSHGRAQSIEANWSEIAKDWRRKSTQMVDAGLPEIAGRVEIDMDDVLAITLDQTWQQFGLPELLPAQKTGLVHAWRRLAPWPDVPSGLPRLRSRYVVAPFTILKTALIIEASRHAGLDWDCIISCEMIGIYKTKRPAYETAAKWLDLRTDQILMTTGHNNDLRAANAYGFRTAFVHRPRQWGDEAPQYPEPDPCADLVCDDFNDLARALGCP